jgi:hypothetical protein
MVSPIIMIIMHYTVISCTGKNINSCKKVSSDTILSDFSTPHFAISPFRVGKKTHYE